MSTPNPQGGGHRRKPVDNLRETTQDELHEARRERRGWRRRKVVMLLMVLPLAAIAAAGFALASPGGNVALPMCTNASAAAGASSGGAGTTATAASGSTTSGSGQSTSTTTANSGNGAAAAVDGSLTADSYSSASSSAGAGASASISAGTGASAPATSAAASTAPTNVAPTNTAPTNVAPTNTAPTNAAPTNTAPTSAAPTNAAPTTAACASASASAAATPDPNCTITVPANPLTAQGLSTPYQLTATDAAMGPCNESNINQTAFVQASVYDPATGALTVYDPLVIDQGTQPAVAPVVPTLPADAVVGIWFGFNATNLTLQDAGGSLTSGKCVNGFDGSVFTQYAYCNAPAFFAAVNQGIRAGKVTVPNPGQAVDGQPCMTTRNFALIDQDQSDNVTTDYLATANGQIAQDDAANLAAMPNATVLANPSDNALLDNFIDPALGCKPWTAPNLGNNGAAATSLGLDELQAAAFPTNPSALVPLNDPMTTINGNFSTQKTNLYRQGVDMPNLPTGETPQQYCEDMDRIQGTRLQQDVNLFINQGSPDTGAASNLFTFVVMRLQQSFGNLNCQNFHLTNPVSTLATDANGVVDAVVFAQTVNPATAGAGNPAQVCVKQKTAAAQTACAFAAVGATPPPAATPTPPEASPTGSATKDPQPRHHRGSHHWW